MEDGMSEEQALLSLFPKPSSKAREKSRESIATGIIALLAKLMLLWPSAEIQRVMANDPGLKDAYKKQDLIQWILAFQQFCLSGSGNSIINVDVAEKRITNLRMKTNGYLEYVNQFRIASENLALCKSTFSQERIVSIFNKNLDQSETGFYRWHKDFLNPRNSLYELQSQPLSESIRVSQEYYDTVIRSSEEDISPKHHSNPKPEPHVLFTAGTKDTVSSRSRVEKRKSDISPSASSKSSKIKYNDNSNSNSVSSKGKAPFGNTTNTVCTKFAMGTCVYGEKCKFLHVKSPK